ncbi:hypothetical protein SLOPH_897 [Spraguea lophii 42_110]|uniref:Uncharacterized protein n=1 Tax=Spraguea lophii (strain 42_110) TaxID=1358809 RepID=S7W885_SPRLO|nr:hypothetical protein SLOPH_897 [Spraguea lophii 42_110]
MYWFCFSFCALNIHFNKEISNNYTKLRTYEDENKIYEFFTDNKKNNPIFIQIHTPVIINRLIELQSPITYIEGNTKYSIQPFKEIIVETDDYKFSAGIYHNTQLTLDNNITQIFENGDYSDTINKKRWKSIVYYIPAPTPLAIERITEKEVCVYEIIIKGNIMTNCITDAINVYPRIINKKKKE